MTSQILQLGPSAVAVFQAHNHSPAVVGARMRLVRHCFGDQVFSKIITRPVEDQGTAILICERTAILEAVHTCQGFRSVAKAIASDPEASLSKPEGEWFQLMLGAAIILGGRRVLLEHRLAGGAPKDIVFDDLSAQVECKAFVTSPC